MLGGDNWGTSDPTDAGLNLMFGNGMQVLSGGNSIGAFENGIPEDTAASAAIADGDDFLDHGDGNYANYAFGNGGNDKIIGGGLFED